MAKLDFLLDDHGNLKFKDGDLVFDDATLQLQEAILVIQKGDLKHAPFVGVGLANWLLDDEVNSLDLKAEIRTQFKADGMEILKIDLTDIGNFKIEANYV